MNMLHFSRLAKPLLIATLLLAFLASCNDDDEPTLKGPIISHVEYGEGSTHSSNPVAYRGSDIHLEAEILAEATISSIAVSIHAHALTPGEGEVEWNFEQTYTDSKYRVKNTTFHEHIDVPSNIPAGEYHITLTVTDERGNSSEVEGHLEILDAITVTGTSIDAAVVRGNDFHVEFLVHAVNGVHHIVVDIHGHDVTVEEGEAEWHYEAEFEEGYHGETEVEFHEHIDVPATAPNGEYHMTITIEDENGNVFEFETHLDVQI